MIPLLQKPLLVGGLGLTAGVWLLGSLDPHMIGMGSSAVWSAVALGSGLWWLNQKRRVERPLLSFTPVDRTAVEKALAEVEVQINHLSTELNASLPETAVLIVNLRQQLAALATELERKSIRLAFLGERSVGKTTLTQLLSDSSISVQKTSIQSTASALDQPEFYSADSAVADAENADLVMFLTTGDITDSEFQTLKKLLVKNHRILLLFNKQDQYLIADRPVILQQIRDRMAGLLATEDIMAIAAQPVPIKVRKHQPDGTFEERFEQPAPDVAILQQRLQQVLTQESQQLILATVKRQAQALSAVVQTELNQVRRQRALPIIEQYQWVAAGAAFANPVPSLDLLATATINAQLVVDLGAIYQQQFSLDQAKTVMGNLASQMVKLGLVEMASQAIAPLLKSHALTYVAGGTLQGTSAAYLTRIAGLSLVEYFEEQSLDPALEPNFKVDRMLQKIKAVFDANQRSEFLHSLVKQSLGRFAPSPLVPATTPTV
ncbi:MAG: DUF697 domain-containing protein [Drouetiella hepatica Uher 2000/2452]|uniref:DUF697 domain-containing protein n=1 Tax=Drouetiella hepatica Uher 2000/2452 TaxID=904376 RepID=A0A951UQR7_9CYAN|nr:DUF697 domain-containing protein [Drouetiella hepatica Uher 2000/2452]